MKRFLYALMIVLMVAGFAAYKPAVAAGVWNTGIDVQNLTADAGSVTVQFYDASGTDAGSITKDITGWGGLNFYLPSEAYPAAGATYSAVVLSTVRVAATVGLFNTTMGGGDNYLGTELTANAISFPLVYRNHGGWNSALTVQNASDTAQDVTLKLYTNGSSTASYTSPATSIPGYASVTFNMPDSTYVDFGPYGYATVEGSAPLAGVAFNTRDTGTGNAGFVNTSYRAFTATQLGQHLIAPLVYKRFNSMTTGINVVNTSGTDTTVTVTYTNSNPAITMGTITDSHLVAANSMYTFYTPSNATGLLDGYYGSATIDSDTSPVAAVISSQRYLPYSSMGNAYEAPLTTDATACVSLPVVHNRTSWKTGINMLNMGGASTVTITYHSSNPATPSTSQTYPIAANSPLTVYMPSDAVTQLGFYGAADVKSDNGALLVVASHTNAGSGIQANYVGMNYTCP